MVDSVEELVVAVLMGDTVVVEVMRNVKQDSDECCALGVGLVVVDIVMKVYKVKTYDVLEPLKVVLVAEHAESIPHLLAEIHSERHDVALAVSETLAVVAEELVSFQGQPHTGNHTPDQGEPVSDDNHIAGLEAGSSGKREKLVA